MGIKSTVVSVKKLKDRNNITNKRFFEILDKHTIDWNKSGNNIQDKRNYSEAFKREWNNWIKTLDLEQ